MLVRCYALKSNNIFETDEGVTPAELDFSAQKFVEEAQSWMTGVRKAA